jgi:hypothetical protein
VCSLFLTPPFSITHRHYSACCRDEHASRRVSCLPGIKQRLYAVVGGVVTKVWWLVGCLPYTAFCKIFLPLSPHTDAV